MEIILQEKVTNLGDLGDKVNVKSGFGRNYLIPSGQAVPATEENLKVFEAKRAELEKQAADKLSEAEQRKTKLEALGSISIGHKAGEEGRLFGSVGTADIATACTDAGVEVSKSEVRLSDGAFRIAGEYEVNLHFHSDVDASIKLTIVAEE